MPMRKADQLARKGGTADKLKKSRKRKQSRLAEIMGQMGKKKKKKR